MDPFGRAEIAASREEIGHWEIDTVVWKKSGSESVVLTIVEKVTDFCIAMKIPDKDPLSVMTAMEVLREKYGEIFSSVFKPITADNRTEFSELSNLEKYGVLVYFAHPYSSWERPQTERHNAFSDALYLREYLLIDILPSRASNMLTAWTLFLVRCLGIWHRKNCLKLFSSNCIQLPMFKMLVSVQFAIAIYECLFFSICAFIQYFHHSICSFVQFFIDKSYF